MSCLCADLNIAFSDVAQTVIDNTYRLNQLIPPRELVPSAALTRALKELVPSAVLTRALNELVPSAALACALNELVPSAAMRHVRRGNPFLQQ